MRGRHGEKPGATPTRSSACGKSAVSPVYSPTPRSAGRAHSRSPSERIRRPPPSVGPAGPRLPVKSETLLSPALHRPLRPAPDLRSPLPSSTLVTESGRGGAPASGTAPTRPPDGSSPPRHRFPIRRLIPDPRGPVHPLPCRTAQKNLPPAPCRAGSRGPARPRPAAPAKGAVSVPCRTGVKGACHSRLGRSRLRGDRSPRISNITSR